MKTSIELKQERQVEIDAQKEIVRIANGREEGQRDLNDDEVKRFNAAQEKIKSLNGKIERAEQYEDNLRSAARRDGNPPAGDRGDGDGDDPDAAEAEFRSLMNRFSLHRAIRSQMPNGVLEGAEAEVHQEVSRRAASAGISVSGIAIPGPARNMQTRADGQTVTQDSGAYGANLVAEDLRSPIEFLRPNPVLRSMGARYLTGLQGDVAFPTNDGGIVATWEGEVDEVANSKTAYGKKSMKPKRLATSVPISLQNLWQSAFDLEAMTVQDINAAVAEAIDRAGINGSGTGDVPEGILNATGTNVIVTGTNGGAPTWDGIVDLETAVYVANANAAQMGYLLNTATKGRLKKTKHAAGDLGYLMEKDNMVNGYPAGITNLMPADLTKGTGDPLSAAIFGDFSQLLIGQWGFYDLTIDNISRKKEGYVEITLNAFLDVLLRQPKAFSIVKDWDLA